MTDGAGHEIGAVWAAAVVALVVSALLVWLLARNGRWLGLVDEPNHRSLHERVTPRSGGLGVLLAIICAWGATAAIKVTLPSGFTLIVVALLAVSAVSLVDDLRDVSPMPRLGVHLFAGISPVLGGFALEAIHLPGVALSVGPALGGVLTLLFIGWFINLFNFMDGMDGFAGGMAMFGFATLSILGMSAGEFGFAAACAAVAGAAAGFLLFNFPPARIFLGDVGSAPLGCLVGVLAVWADYSGVAPLWISVMIFAPFFLDATVTLFRRLMRRERVWEAHRSHYYQRSVQAGWSHRRTVLREYLLMAGSAATAVLVIDAAVLHQWAAVGAWLLVYVLCAINVHAREQRASR